MKKLFYSLIFCFFALNISAQVYVMSDIAASNITTMLNRATTYQRVTNTNNGKFVYKIEFVTIINNKLNITLNNGSVASNSTTINNGYIYEVVINSTGNYVLNQVGAVDLFSVSVTVVNAPSGILKHVTHNTIEHSSSTSGTTKTYNFCKQFYTQITFSITEYVVASTLEAYDPYCRTYNINSTENHAIRIRWEKWDDVYYIGDISEIINLNISKTAAESKAIDTKYFNNASFGSIVYKTTYTTAQVANWLWISTPFDATISIKAANGAELKLTYTGDPNQNYKNPCFLLRQFNSEKRAQSKLDYWTEVKQPKLTAGVGYILGIDPRTITQNIIVTYTSINSTNYNNNSEFFTLPASSTSSNYSNQHLIGTKHFFPARFASLSSEAIYIAKVNQNKFEYFCAPSSSSSATMEPFTSFYVQYAGELRTDKNSVSIVAAPAVAQIQTVEEAPQFETYTLKISGSEWDEQTTILIKPDKTDEDRGFLYFTEDVDGIPFANQFYSIHQEMPQSFNLRAKEDQTISLGGCLQNSGEYTISLNETDVTAKSVLLTDTKNETTTELTTDSYKFTATEGENLTNRFIITLNFAPKTPTDAYVVEANQIIVYGNAQNCNITNLTAGEIVVIYDATGRLVYNQTAQSNNININLTPGTYIVRQSNKSARFAVK